MNYLQGMNLGRTVKKPTAQVPMILTATLAFGLGYKPMDDDLLEMEVRKMAQAKAKAKGLPCPPEPLKPYTPTLKGKFVKAEESQRYWGFPEPRFDPMTRTMMSRFEILLDCNNKVLELKKEDATWVHTDQADFIDPDAITTLIGDVIHNIEEKEYWEACQHVLKSLYELRANDEEAAPSDDDDGSDDKSDSSSNSSSNDSGHDDDDNNGDSESNNSEDYDSQYSGNDQGKPLNDREVEDTDLFYEEYDDDVDYYD